MKHPLTLKIQIEENVPPIPKRASVVCYPFETVPVGGSAVFPRAANTVKGHLVKFRKVPGNAGMKFKIRAISEDRTRVWRVA